ncbi:MAG TPA: DUF2064 domain-containing protein [Planctomycetota bacterium]|nr:DUF2064 domain-containing protein [Planctomycetota bacterium]
MHSLVVMAKAPEPGRVKMRLASSIGGPRALQVYRQLLAVTAAAANAWPGPVLLATAGDPAAFAGSGLERFECVPQPEGELGVRIAAALRAGRERAPSTIVIGSDCPGLDADALRAVAALSTIAAFGPAVDGGFWSIATGVAATADVLERTKVPWSTSNTLALLRAELADAGLRSQLGPTLADCDTELDLRRAIAAGHLPPLPPESAA